MMLVARDVEPVSSAMSGVSHETDAVSRETALKACETGVIATGPDAITREKLPKSGKNVTGKRKKFKIRVKAQRTC